MLSICHLFAQIKQQQLSAIWKKSNYHFTSSLPRAIINRRVEISTPRSIHNGYRALRPRGGYYVVVNATANNEGIHEFERLARINHSIVRYMIIKTQDEE